MLAAVTIAADDPGYPSGAPRPRPHPGRISDLVDSSAHDGVENYPQAPHSRTPHGNMPGSPGYPSAHPRWSASDPLRRRGRNLSLTAPTAALGEIVNDNANCDSVSTDTFLRLEFRMRGA